MAAGAGGGAGRERSQRRADDGRGRDGAGREEAVSRGEASGAGGDGAETLGGGRERRGKRQGGERDRETELEQAEHRVLALVSGQQEEATPAALGWRKGQGYSDPVGGPSAL